MSESDLTTMLIDKYELFRTGESDLIWVCDQNSGMVKEFMASELCRPIDVLFASKRQENGAVQRLERAIESQQEWEKFELKV